MDWMEQTETRNRSQAKYDKAHTKGIYLKLNLRTDKDIIWWTWNQQSVQGSIKRLINFYCEKFCCMIKWEMTKTISISVR